MLLPSKDDFRDYYLLTSHLVLKKPLEDNKPMIVPPQKKRPKIVCSKETGKIVHIYLSKSLLKRMFYKGELYTMCPYKTYVMDLTSRFQTSPTEAQLKGLYFETKCLGGSANNEKTYDLPRHSRTGKKLADHDRIDKAVELFRYVEREYKLIVDPKLVQVHASKIWGDNENRNVTVHLEGTLDLASPITVPGKYSFDIINIDLKLTKDRDICHSHNSMDGFTIMPWGCPENIDFTEAMFYRLLFDLPFMYLVFDYKSRGAYFKDILIATDVNDPSPVLASRAKLRMRELYETMRKAVETILEWEHYGWPLEPSEKSCANCPVMDCKKRFGYNKEPL